MKTGTFIAATAGVIIVGAVLCIEALERFSFSIAQLIVAVVVTIGGVGWSALFVVYWTRTPQGEARSNEKALSKLEKSTVSDSVHITETVTIVQTPPPEEMRQYLRLERFLGEATFRTKMSKQIARNMLVGLHMTKPYLTLGAEVQRQIEPIRKAVDSESMRAIRAELVRYFKTTQNVLSPILVPSVSTPPTKVVTSILFDDTLTVEATTHREVHYDLKKGTIVSGIVQETSGQDFDFYIMDRANYTEFCETRESTELFEAYNRTTVEFKKTVPKDDVWYFVVDTYGKQNDRDVQLEIKMVPPP